MLFAERPLLLSMDLRSGTTGDHAAILGLLQDSGLPIDDLAAGAIDFTVAAGPRGLVGVVGLEPFGDTGLLRSMAVRADQRGHGIGEQLIGVVETQAVALGLRRLVLLTQTAEPFFARRGYLPIHREQAPASVRSSAEFRSICPTSATCMIKSLEPFV